MSDIVERLKNRARPHERGFPSRLIFTAADAALDIEAATDILRLRAEVERLLEVLERFQDETALLVAGAERREAEAMERAAQIAGNMVIVSHEDGRDVERPVLFRGVIAAAIRAEASKKGGDT